MVVAAYQCCLQQRDDRDAELRLLPPLRRDRRGLIVSRNIVRSEANSIYRKLGASSRSGAVAQVGGLGLPDW
jgi:hypothetical protein